MGCKIDTLVNFYRGIKTDIQEIRANTDNPENKRMRIASVALRIIATVIFVYCACAVISAIFTVLVAPLTGISLLISALFGLIIAHDCIIVGINKSKALAHEADLVKSFFEHPIDVISGALHTGATEIEDSIRGTHHLLKDTWLFERVYKTFKCGS